MINTLYALNSLESNENMVRKNTFFWRIFLYFLLEKNEQNHWFSKKSVNKKPTLILHTLLNEGYPCESGNHCP